MYIRMSNAKKYLKLSDMTQVDEDHLFHIDTAVPVPAPTLFMLIGSPGAGKSSGHSVAQQAMKAILGEGNWGGSEAPPYVSIDLDLLVERMEPFRVASMIHRIISHNPVLSAYMIPPDPRRPRNTAKKAASLNTMKAYISESQNLELFNNIDWLMAKVAADAAEFATPELIEAKAILDELAPLRGRWRTVKGQRLGREAALYLRVMGAITRAMAKRVNIVYETTLTPPAAGGPACSLGADGQGPPIIKKFDELFDLAQSMGYGIHLYHVGYSGPDAEMTVALVNEIQQRITGRQEYNSPFRDAPFYRHVPLEGIPKLVENNAVAFKMIRACPKYSGVTFRELNPLERMGAVGRPAARPFNLRREVAATIGAYIGEPVVGGYTRRRRHVKRRSHRRSHKTVRRR
jgi:hypothetical protein